MALRSLAHTGFTATATADTTTMTTLTFLALQGGSATQRARIDEVYMGGLSPTSAKNIMLLAFDSTVAGATMSKGTGCTDTALDASAVALATVVSAFNTTSGTFPQRDAAKHLLNLTFNGFGGIVRWVANQTQGSPTLVGTAVSLGEISLSAFTGSAGDATGVAGHIIYEPY